MRRAGSVIVAGALLAAAHSGAPVISTATAATAPSSVPCGAMNCPGPSDESSSTSARSGGGSISVSVRGTGVAAGGGTFSIPATTVRTNPVCWYSYFTTGQTYAESWSGGSYRALMAQLPDEDHFTPWPGYLTYKDDDEGGWWVPRCSSAHWPGEWSGFSEFARTYFAENDPVYVEAGDVPPESDVSPEVLAEIAFEALELPTGTIDWNPKHQGDSATFVGMDTWVWVEDAAMSVEVTATVSTGTWARVDAVLSELTVEAPNAAPVTCSDAGIPWSTSADPAAACRLIFERSSANQPLKEGSTVPTATTTATATWTASWVSNLDDTPRELPAQEIETVGEIPVGEIQALVTR